VIHPYLRIIYALLPEPERTTRMPIIPDRWRLPFVFPFDDLLLILLGPMW